MVEPVYVALADWNDYVRNSVSTSDVFHQTETACTGSEVGIGACIHAGELRRVVVSSRSSCAGLSITDSLGAFAWVCQDGSGNAIFYSAGLASGRGLGELIDSNGWKANAVTVTELADVVAESAPAVWGWSNPVVALPDSTGAAVELAAAGTIYYADASRASNGYNLGADRIAFVALPGVTISYGGSPNPNANSTTGLMTSADLRVQIAAGGAPGQPRAFLWIEGNVDARAAAGADAERNLLLVDVALSRVHRVNAARSLGHGVELYETWSSELTDVSITEAGGEGLRTFWGPGHIRFDRIVVDRAALAGLHEYGTGGFNLLTHITVTNCDDGIVFHSTDSRLYSIHTHHNSNFGFVMIGHRNVLVGLVTSNNVASGLREWGMTAPETTANTFVDIVAVNNGQHAVYAQISANSTYAHITGINNGASGLMIGCCPSSTSIMHTFVDLVTANSTSFGIALDGDPGSDGHVFAHVAGTHAGLNSVYLRNAGHRFTGSLWVSPPSPYCDVAGATDRGVLQDTCTDSGADLSSSYTGLTGPVSDAVLHVNVDLSTTFVGKVVRDDTTNPVDASGAANVAGIDDWVSFDNRFRAWGMDGSAFPSADHRGRCTGTCRIWDARLRSDDTHLLNAFGAFQSGGPCPSSVSGPMANVIIDQQPTPNTFLAHAIEIVLDGVGDDDGLCESGEACVYAPNLGAYQGEGDPLPCTFVDGTISSVILYGYPTNGGTP